MVLLCVSCCARMCNFGLARVRVGSVLVFMWVCEFFVCVCVCVCWYLLACGFVNVALWCVRVHPFLSVCVCVCVCVCVWGGSLVSLLNIKQLEVIKYLGSAGSLRILILPFPSVSQISLSFSLLSLSFSPPPPFHPDSPILFFYSPATSLSLSPPHTFGIFGPNSP